MILYPPELLPYPDEDDEAEVIFINSSWVVCSNCHGFDNFCHKCGGWGLIPADKPKGRFH